ncbi:cupin domain-containing protein [Advenella mimigardefordensis]|uniref:cupin domain-containing protein n=1 Tax=Advenella mimigardefordensis TaxID=302406 RepID=UPI00046D82B7|nr:cupin domain-containing protein [Advenella mimigardefordensis]
MSHVPEQQALTENTEKHCQAVSVAGHTNTSSAVARSRGDAFDVSIHTMQVGETVTCEALVAGEEVGAVLSGQFTIVAADEHYQLSRGEGIIIPPGAARTWTCDSAEGRLYRVVNRASLENQSGAAL